MLQSTSLSPESLLRILDVTRKLAAPFELTDVLAEIGEAARTVLNAERATVWLNDPDTGDLVLIGGPGQTAGGPPFSDPSGRTRESLPGAEPLAGL